MAFFPEMKTALRTYHPVPSLQKTDGNAQDAPRIKNCLKAALLPSELKTAPPSTPEEVLEKRNSGLRPPTSVVNLVFILANHAAPLASVHFDGSLNFLDLFLPNKKLASADRGRAFLWLLYHYLEDHTGPNPFDDAFSVQNPGKIPTLHRLSSAEYARENVDTPEEIEWGQMMSNQRNIFLQKLVSATDKDRPVKTSAPHFVAGSSESVYTPRATRHNSQDAKDFLFYVPSKDAQPMVHQRSSLPHHHLPPPVMVPPPNSRERSMFQQAWHVAKSVDPLHDSDEETDHHARLDY
ncbi:hypothetical protein CVT24_005761 [Panaeolus cyanescens]|uniref:Ino eighty subunit 1 n=1 Tax=Panaeolus cyanescens TaxID=181874 RepID=A0A409YF33_9AGAR|nr:hypothetical protein CVT24_005761 [Panaeolus cyanescens]